MPRGHGAAVVAQHAAQPHERVVDVGDLGLHGLLVAADRADQVALQMAGETASPGRPMPASR